jgi:hypothetical protein
VINYLADNEARALLESITQYTTVEAVSNIYTIDLANRPIKNVRIETKDANPKTVALANVPSGDCEIFIELTYTNSAAITWFNNVIWLSAPTFTAGKVYRLAFYKAGNNWHGNCVGGW